MTTKTQPTDVAPAAATASEPTSALPDTASDGNLTEPMAEYGGWVGSITSDKDESYGRAIATYVEASSGDKARMRTWLTKTAQDSMLNLDVSDTAAVARTKALVNLQKAQSDAVGTRESAPADPRVDVALVVAALVASAYQHLTTYEGSPGDTKYICDLVELATDVPVGNFMLLTDDILSPDVLTLRDRIKVPSGRRGTSAAGGDIAEHIRQALESVPADTTLTVAEIKSACTDAYPTGAPSGGAISARLFPTKGSCTVPGVKPTLKDGKKAATLA